MKLLRNADQWVGLLVVLSVALFVAAALNAGLLGSLFRPVATLRVVLPETGGSGLAAGADVQLLGTRIGTVQRIVIDPSQRFYAVAELDTAAKDFIRRDSVGVVRKSFGVAGAAFLDISRGAGEPLDWSFAVIDAIGERTPVEALTATIEEVRAQLHTVLDDAGRATRSLAETAEGIGAGRGSLGRLARGDELADELAQVLANLKGVTALLEAGLRDVRGMTAAMGRQDGMPALMRRAEAALASVQSAARDLAAASPQLPGLTRNVSTATANLPALITQAQQAAADLEKLSRQLRNTWPISGSAAPEQRRLPAAQVRP